SFPTAGGNRFLRLLETEVSRHFGQWVSSRAGGWWPPGSVRNPTGGDPWARRRPSGGVAVPLLQPAELAIGSDELPEQGVVLGVRRWVELLKAPPEVRAPATQRELLEPGPHVLGV